MVQVLHQLGFRYKWNLSSLEEDRAGDGVICAARYMAPDVVTSLPTNVRTVSLFDPQFYVPDSGKGHLPDYHFFPHVIADGFSKTGYSNDHAQESAARCLRFQVEQGFGHLVIPTRYREATPSDFIESQWSMFVQPFLKAAAEGAYRVPILLQLILNDAMLKDDRFRNGILNWVTGIHELSGLYFNTAPYKPAKTDYGHRLFACFARLCESYQR
jgi:hypothetical protein